IFLHPVCNVQSLGVHCVETNNIFFINVNLDILTQQEQATIQQVLTTLPEKQINSIVLPEDIYKVLQFIQDQKNKGSTVSLKLIKKHLHLSYPTIKKTIKPSGGKRINYEKKTRTK
ncbi:MAG: hypothetical protein U9R21_02465, partial [Candidatus Thermoplasmatota archaeon]|nr:hypothetical protein [Candidatus Thermoplasmatota archaeon]